MHKRVDRLAFLATAQDVVEPDPNLSSVELQFPTLPVETRDGSRPGSALAVVDMALPWDGNSDTGSSLGESAYEILSDSIILTDDSDHDDSIVSAGQLTPADVASLAGTDDGEEDSEAAISTNPGRSEEQPLGLSIEEVNGSQATLQDRPQRSSSPIDPEPESEADPSAAANAAAKGCTDVRVIRTFNEAETTSLLRKMWMWADNSAVRLIGTLHQRMSPLTLDVMGPFRVLYVGHPSAKKKIIAKLASSLADPDALPRPVRHGSVRYQVVPTSMLGGDQGSAEVELIDSLGLEIVVDQCTGFVNHMDPDRGTGTRSLQVNGQSWCSFSDGRDGGRLAWEGRAEGTPPDLCIIYRSELDDAGARKVRLQARTFMARLGVPFIILAESAMYERASEIFPLDTHSIHVCLEAADDDPWCPRIFRRLPVDLRTFLDVPAHDLNRHLAYLIERSKGSRESDRARDRTRCVMASPEDGEKSSQKTGASPGSAVPSGRRPARQWQALALLALIVVGSLMAVSVTVLHHKFAGTPTLGPQVLPDAFDRIWRSTPWRTPSLSTVPLTLPPSTPAQPASARSGPGSSSLATDAAAPTSLRRVAIDAPRDLTDKRYPSSFLTAGATDKFHAQVVGDRHILVWMPRKLATARAPPAWDVRVKRDGRAVPFEANPLDGVYTIELRREEAWGVLDVVVRTPLRSHSEQTLQADLGTPRWPVVAYRKAAAATRAHAHHRLQRAHARLDTSTGWIKAGVHHALRRMDDARAAHRHRARPRWHAALAHASRRARPIQRLSDEVQRLSDEVKRRQGSLVRQLAALATDASARISQQTAALHAVGGRVRRHAWADVCAMPTRTAQTLTVARARKQAGRLWSRMGRHLPRSLRSPSAVTATHVPSRRGGRKKAAAAARSIRRWCREWLAAWP
ncbi:MAG: hypothetical protein M1826_002471 [Phylliscum demangeonii]|nr:MAG: hypothetical protein M1826_002471 [Phylliscum demangeonii]